MPSKQEKMQAIKEILKELEATLEDVVEDDMVNHALLINESAVQLIEAALEVYKQNM